MNNAWTAHYSTTAPGWLRLPTFDDSSARAGWIDERTQEIIPFLSEASGDDAYESIRRLLDLALKEVAGTELAAFAVLPFRFPMMTVVKAFVADREALPSESTAREAAATRIETEHLGSGVQLNWTERRQDEELSLTTQIYCFADQRHAVLITVEPIHTMGALALMPGLSGFIQSLNVTRADGSVFRGEASAYYPQLVEVMPADSWATVVSEQAAAGGQSNTERE